MKVDVAIVGGGMVGASLALALPGAWCRRLARRGVAPGSGAQPSFDDRTTALGNASRRIFESLGVWGDIAPQAAGIRTIHVSDAGRFGFARLRAEEQGIDAFGYVVANRVIGTALWRAVVGVGFGRNRVRVPAKAEDIEVSGDGAAFTLGGDGFVRERVEAHVFWSWRRTGLTPLFAPRRRSKPMWRTTIKSRSWPTSRPIVLTMAPRMRGSLRSGPLAVLPLYDGSYGVIWALCRPADASWTFCLCDDASYLRELQARFGWRAGRFVRVGRRASYPLKLTRAAGTRPRRAPC